MTEKEFKHVMTIKPCVLVFRGSRNIVFEPNILRENGFVEAKKGSNSRFFSNGNFPEMEFNLSFCEIPTPTEERDYFLAKSNSLSASKIKHINEMGGTLAEGKQVVYIAGKVTGLPFKEVEEKFAKAQKELCDAGYFCINPVQIIHPETNHREAMRICFNLLPHADFIFLLPDWHDSKGANMEVQIAEMLQIPSLNG